MSSSPVIGPNLEEHHRSVALQSTTAIPFDQLRADIRGTVIAPDDAGYDEACTIVSESSIAAPAARTLFVDSIDRAGRDHSRASERVRRADTGRRPRRDAAAG